MDKKMPICPNWLEADAKNEWDRIMSLLKEFNLQSNIDEVILSGYCQVYARWIEAEKFITKFGPVYKSKAGVMRSFPQVDMAQKYLLIMHKFYKELKIPTKGQFITNNKVVYFNHDGIKRK